MTDALVEELIAAYQTGRRRPFSLPPPPSRRAEEACRDESLRSIPPTQRKTYVRIDRLRQRGFDRARESELQEASHLLDQARTLWVFTRDSLSPVARLTAQTMLEASISYLSYKQERFGAAAKESAAALATTLRLEHDHGCSCLAARKVHLLNNHLRVVARSGHPGQAVARLGTALLYLEGSPDAWPFDPSPPASPLTPEDETFDQQRSIGIQLVWELIDLFQRHPSRSADFLRRIRAYRTESPPTPLPRLRDLLVVKHAFCHHLPGRAMRQAARFLSAGRAENALAWHVCVADVCRYAGTLAGPAAQRLRRRLLQDTEALTGYPSGLRRRIDTLYRLVSSTSMPAQASE